MALRVLSVGQNIQFIVSRSSCKLKKNSLLSVLRSFQTNSEATLAIKTTDNVQQELSLVSARVMSNFNSKQTPLKLSPMVSSALFSRASFFPAEDQELSYESLNGSLFLQDLSLIDFLKQCHFLSQKHFDADVLSNSLSKCSNLKDIVHVFTRNSEDVSINAAGVALAKIWDIVLTNEINQNSPVSAVESAQLINRVLPDILSVIDHNYQTLDTASQISILSQLRSFGITSENSTFCKIFLHLLGKKDSLTLEEVTRFLHFLTSPDLNYNVKGKFVPILEKFIDSCSTIEQLNLINYCMFSIQNLSSSALLTKHAKKMEEFLDNFSTDISHPYTLFTFLKFYRFPSELGYGEVLEKVGKKFAMRGSAFSWAELGELKVFCRAFRTNRHLQENVQEQSLKLIDEVHSPHIKAELYLGLKPKIFHYKKAELIELLSKIMESPQSTSHLNTVYYALRLLGSSDSKLLDAYWEKSLSIILADYQDTEILSKKESTLSETYSRYINFNYNLSGTYRNKQLEDKIRECLLEEMEGVSGLMTERLSRMTAFLIAYSHPSDIPNIVTRKLVAFRDQFNMTELHSLTQGLLMSLSLNSHNRSRNYASSIVSISHILLDVSKRLSQESSNLDSLVKVYRCVLVFEQALSKFSGYSITPQNYSANAPKFSIRSLFPQFERAERTVNGDRVQVKLLKKIEQNTHQLNPMLIYNLSLCIIRSNLYCPQLLDSMLLYTANNSSSIFGDVVCRLLFACFMVGHQSSLPPSTFEKVANLLIEDMSSLHGLLCLQAGIALCHYNVLPAPFINFVFNVSFLDQLDVEIRSCSAKGTYPNRVRRILMEFNRSTCILHPEAGVPWFHDEYCRDQAASARQMEGSFRNDVKESLINLLGDDKYIVEDVYSPYHHQINFEFVLDKDNSLVPHLPHASSLPKRRLSNVSDDSTHRRFCVLLFNPSCYASRLTEDGDSVSSLIGWMRLRVTQLEALGYSVVTIPRHEWQNMCLSSQQSKQEYLKKKIINV